MEGVSRPGPVNGSSSVGTHPVAVDSGRGRGTLPALRSPLWLAFSGGAALVVLHVRDPHVPGAYGHCAFLTLTGIPCPVCGGLRAVNDLTRGRVVEAVSSNAWVVLTAGAVVVWWVLWVGRRLRGREAPLAAHSTSVVIAWSIGLVVFGALRLVPALAWLRP